MSQWWVGPHLDQECLAMSLWEPEDGEERVEVEGVAGFLVPLECGHLEGISPPNPLHVLLLVSFSLASPG